MNSNDSCIETVCDFTADPEKCLKYATCSNSTECAEVLCDGNGKCSRYLNSVLAIKGDADTTDPTVDPYYDDYYGPDVVPTTPTDDPYYDNYYDPYYDDYYYYSAETSKKQKKMLKQETGSKASDNWSGENEDPYPGKTFFTNDYPYITSVVLKGSKTSNIYSHTYCSHNHLYKF